MKIKLSLITVIQLSVICCFSQNVGIGTTEPYNKLHIVGSLLVNTPTLGTNTAPTAAQTKTLPGLGTISFLASDSTGRLYDPGGPSGNYGLDLDSKANIPASTNIAMEVTLETVDLNTLDSLIIRETSTGPVLFAAGNVYNTPGKWIFNVSSLYIHFKSNVDFNTGAGFSLLFRRLYSNSSSLPNISGFAGTALFFDAKTGALRSGYIDNSAKGQYSFAMGNAATASGNVSTALGSSATASGLSSIAMGAFTGASGDYSTAMGWLTGARGDYSTAMGKQTAASGESSTAMGSLTSATNIYSTAMGRYTDAAGYASTAMGDSSQASGLISFASGFRTTASGDYATAMGRQTTASGDFSTAIGNNVSTNGKTGSFIIGDNSSSAVLLSPVNNFFMARFAGGYHLITSSNLSTGCSLQAGDNAWTTGSSMHIKENFAEVNGEEFLKKISGFHLTSWNYKKQDPKTFRHYGPMAQDFYAAFGKDKYGTIGNDTTINSADFAGVSFIAIQALEKRSSVQQQDINNLKKENSELKEMILMLRKEMDNLKKQSAKE